MPLVQACDIDIYIKKDLYFCEPISNGFDNANCEILPHTPLYLFVVCIRDNHLVGVGPVALFGFLFTISDSPIETVESYFTLDIYRFKNLPNKSQN